MRRRTWLIMILALFLVGSTTLVGQISAAVFTTFTGDDTFNPFNGIGRFASLGTVMCPGHEPEEILPDVFACPAGSRTQIRGLVIETVFSASDPRVSGTATITVNANYDADGTGPAWGTISLAVAGGTWVGTWQGVRVKEGTAWVVPVHASVKGTGELEGLMYSAVDQITSYSLDGYPSVLIAYYGLLEGRIIDPNAK